MIINMPKNSNNFFIHYKQSDYKYTHKHNNFWEFALITEGKVLHKINNNIMQVSKNTLLILRSQDYHSLTQVGHERTCHINLGIKESYFKNIIDSINPNTYEFLLSLPYIAFSISASKINKILDLYLKHQSTNNTTKENSTSERNENILLVIFLNLLTTLFDNINSNQNTTKEKKYSTFVDLLLHEFENPANYSQKLPILIKKTGYSYSHVNKVFKEEIGVAPAKYFLKTRIERAKDMIDCEDKKLLEIAFDIGFSSYAHFSTIFKKTVGISPSQYLEKQGGLYQATYEEDDK